MTPRRRLLAAVAGVAGAIAGCVGASDTSSTRTGSPTDRPRTDGGTVVDPADTAAVRDHLERFAGVDAVTTRDDGAIRADFGGVTHVVVRPDGRVETGMPLHEFSGPVEALRFDHEAAALHVTAGEGIEYTFRRP